MATVKYTGPVASFHCPTEATIRSLKVHFSPKQLGSGTPSPDNVREIVGWDGVEVKQKGKNLFDANNPNIISPNCWINSQNTERKITKSGTDRTLYISCLPNTTYIISKTIGDVLAASYTTELPTLNIPTYSYMRDRTYARQVTVTTGSDAKYLAIWFYDSSKTYDKTVQPEDIYKTLQVEYGSTVTSYESYRGETINYKFGVLGKNKFDPIYKNSSQYTIGGAYGYYYTEPIYLIPNTTYTIKPTSSGKTEHWYWAVGIYTDTYNVGDKATFKYVFNNGSYGVDYTFTTGPSGVIRYATNNKTKFEEVAQNIDIQLELGNTATAYEPYDPNHTVYGGWVDLIMGEVCEEWRLLHFVKNYFIGVVDMSGVNYAVSAAIGSAQKAKLFYCDKLNSTVVHTSNNAQLNPPYDGSISPDKRLVFALPEEITTLEQVKDLIDNIGGLDVAYEVESPSTYHLAPTQLQTFLGANNVWSNADYVEVEYDLYETQDILARKQFIIASQPHVETLAAAPLQNFMTDITAPLKECKVYFNPKQEGEGDPSPDNVRPITGWTTLKISHTNIAYPYISGGIIGANGIDNNVTTRIKTDYIKYNNESQLILNGQLDSDDRFAYIYWYDSSKKFISIQNLYNSNIPYTYIVSAPENAAYYRITVNKTTSTNNINATNKYLTVNSTIMTNTLDWTNDIGILYGGYIDLIKGELVKTYTTVDLSIATWNVSDAANGLFFTNNFLVYGAYKGPDQIPDLFCDQMIIKTRNEFADKSLLPDAGDYWIGISVNNNGYNFILIQSPNLANKTTAEVKNAVNGICVYFKMPADKYQYYPIDPVILKTLRSANNIWSDANGQIELSYWTH